MCNHSIVDVSIKGSIHPYRTTSLDCLSGDVAWDVVPLELSITDTLVGLVREFETQWVGKYGDFDINYIAIVLIFQYVSGVNSQCYYYSPGLDKTECFNSVDFVRVTS